MEGKNNIVLNEIKQHAVKAIIDPIGDIIDSNVSDIVTTIGSFIVRSIRGKFQRSITFTYGSRTYNDWMKPALFSILAKYNDFKSNTNLELSNSPDDETVRDNVRYELGEGTHNLKYRKWNVLLVIQKISTPGTTTRFNQQVIQYTVITFDLDVDFVRCFEADMKKYQNSIMKLKPESPTVTIYKDYHENDGWTYWVKVTSIPKRKMSTIYIPKAQKRLLVDSLNNFFHSKQFYIEHGLAWNFKILLYGKPSTGKDSIARMIASEWNRNIYQCTGGRLGKFIPNAISDDDKTITSPLLLISDIDRYPAIINEPTIDPTAADNKMEAYEQKQTFANMLNALDGVTSPNGRIIVMTCNDINALSPTLIRPGRVDLMMEIGYVVPETFRQFVYDMYNLTLPEDIQLNANDITITKMQFDVICGKLTAEEFVRKYTK